MLFLAAVVLGGSATRWRHPRRVVVATSAALRRHRQVQVLIFGIALIVLMIFRRRPVGARRAARYGRQAYQAGRKGEQISSDNPSPIRSRGTSHEHRDDSLSVPVEGAGGEVEQMSEDGERSHFARSPRSSHGREIEVAVGETLLRLRGLTVSAAVALDRCRSTSAWRDLG